MSVEVFVKALPKNHTFTEQEHGMIEDIAVALTSAEFTDEQVFTLPFKVPNGPVRTAFKQAVFIIAETRTHTTGRLASRS